MEYQTCIYTQDKYTKSITLRVVELGGSEKSAVENALNTFTCLALDMNEILKIETREI